MESLNLNIRKAAEKLDMKGIKEITEQFLTGAAIADALDDLATLRLDIFPEYPVSV